MTDELLDKLKNSIEMTEKYLPLVPKNIPVALRYSIAKYYPSLKKLAAE